ncbi:MAG: glycosyltransferase family 39 protein [Candidatus Shapirobacteria bacterium]|nr:glycosyltransferase family 39 protein [Candidatus Shapirobacteria bacterium]
MKNKKIIFIISLVVLTALYLFLRLYKFEEKTTYHLDQGLHLLETYQMVEDKKIRLIGPMVSSKTFMDRGFFIGPQYYYVLAGLGILTKWNPISIDVILLLIELVFILYFVNWTRKKYGIVEALMVFSIFTFSRYFIIHSRFFWNPHFLLPLGVLAIIFLDKYIQKSKIKYLAFFGILWGMAFGFHYSAVFWALPLFIVLLINKKLWKWQNLTVPIFFILGNLPWFVFEIKHNFYNIKTMWMVMTQSSGGGKMEPHYFIYPLGFFILVGLAWMLKKINKNKLFVALILVLGISYLQLKLIHNPIPYGHPDGWNYPIQKEIIKKILNDGCPKNFNVASTISSDTRFYDLRFLLVAKGCKPMGVEEYPNAEKLFLITPNDRPPETEKVWEVTSLGKFKIDRRIDISPIIIFYELEKI